jgi:hypothetical protein
MKYLYDEQYYIDRYDLSTIKEFIDALKFWKKTYTEDVNDEKIKHLTLGERAKGFNYFSNWHLYSIQGERYRKKKDTIQQWMNRDRLEQEKYDNTPEPKDVVCPECKELMSTNLKHLESFDDPLVMMFLFECSKCKKKLWINEDGTGHKSEPQLCPKCKAEVKVSLIKEGKKKITWKTTCSSCGFTETTVDDFEKSKAERKKQEEEDKLLLEKYREECCLSDEKGKEYIELIEAMDVANEAYEEELLKYDSSAYQYAVQLKKISIVDLEKLLNEQLEKSNYIKLSFEKPEVSQYFIVPFNVQDADSSRKEHISVADLKKLINDVLEGTNWRLMKDSVFSRLGYISGRLKGYEREEDFFELSGKKKEPKPSKIDSEKQSKYSSHNLVQFARMSGEFKGIENVRKRRLEKEPEGFFLEGGEGPYSCWICGENRYGSEIWWNLDGLRCVDCWRNIKEGVIPSLKHRYDNGNTYFQDWQIKSDFGIHSSTARKLRREGLLYGRDLKKENGSIYCTIYLDEENKEFLEKYPRLPKQKFIITDLEGKEIEL